jgi:hypothetical protein
VCGGKEVSVSLRNTKEEEGHAPRRRWTTERGLEGGVDDVDDGGRRSTRSRMTKGREGGAREKGEAGEEEEEEEGGVRRGEEGEGRSE